MITGHITSLEVPDVQVGENIKATITWEAVNPDAWYWKSWVIVHIYGMDIKLELDATREIGQYGGRTQTLTLVKAPDKEITLQFTIFAHDDARYDWSWDEYDRWFMGEAVNVVSVASESVTFNPTPHEDLKVLSYEIIGEKQGGHIIPNPYPIDDQGHYHKHTVVDLMAIPNAGFDFVEWDGEVDEKPSTDFRNTVTMSENREIEARFKLETMEKLWPLEVDIEPPEGGYVTTNPAPVDKDKFFNDGDVGKFNEGTRVKVTAYADPGGRYRFSHWSDEIQGGTSYNQSEWVADTMTEHRAVKAHFDPIGEKPPVEPPVEPPFEPPYIPPVGPPVGPPDDGKDIPWGWIGLGLVAVLALTPGSKSTKGTKRR